MFRPGLGVYIDSRKFHLPWENGSEKDSHEDTVQTGQVHVYTYFVLVMWLEKYFTIQRMHDSLDLTRLDFVSKPVEPLVMTGGADIRSQTSDVINVPTGVTS